MAMANDGQSTAQEVAYLFVDLSNIYLGAREAARRRGEAVDAVRLHAGHLHALLAWDRPVGAAVVVANSEVTTPALGHFRRARFEVETREVGRWSRTEQANDELLINRVWEVVTNPYPTRGVIVLATGDGNGWHNGHGFALLIERALQVGWRVELLAWEASLNQHLREVVTAGDGRVQLLDDWYYAVTFLEAGRRAQPLIHYRRPVPTRQAEALEVPGEALPMPGLRFARLAWRAAWPRHRWSDRHLGEWVSELRWVMEQHPQGTWEVWVDLALDRVGLGPRGREQLVRVIDRFFHDLGGLLSET